MQIKVLVEDTSDSPSMRSEHGFSIYIETQSNKILFDMGASNLFLENANKMGVKIKDIDLAIISHGHYDHGGGLRGFLEENENAKVYIHNKAFERHFSKRSEKIANIGLDKSLINHDRITFTDDIFPINNNLLLFSRVVGSEFYSSCNKSLFAEHLNSIVQDDFEHEQNLIITENGKIILIAGCAHRGIVNILKSSVFLNYKEPDYVIGGFHLLNYSERISEDPSVVHQIGDFLKKTRSKYYTGHCTGSDAYYHLKTVMGEQIQYLSTGSVVEI